MTPAVTDQLKALLKQPPQGFVLEWKKCCECGKVYRHVYQPYSLSNPITWTPCGHSNGHQGLNCDTIPLEEAIPLLVEQLLKDYGVQKEGSD